MISRLIMEAGSGPQAAAAMLFHILEYLTRHYRRKSLTRGWNILNNGCPNSRTSIILRQLLTMPQRERGVSRFIGKRYLKTLSDSGTNNSSKEILLIPLSWLCIERSF